MAKVSNERLAEMIAGLSVEAGPKETLGDVTARRLCIASPDELGSILTHYQSLRNAQSEAVAVRLVWEPEGGTHGIYAEDGFGGLYFAYDDGAWSSPRKSFPAPLDGSGSIETAKVAAQAHHALTHPAPPLAVTDEMALALTKQIEREFYRDHPGGAVQVRAKVQSIIADALTAALEAKQ
jgi:hypothetical protein